jgi:hypothetical protein
MFPSAQRSIDTFLIHEEELHYMCKRKRKNIYFHEFKNPNHIIKILAFFFFPQNSTIFINRPSFDSKALQNEEI